MADEPFFSFCFCAFLCLFEFTLALRGRGSNVYATASILAGIGGGSDGNYVDNEDTKDHQVGQGTID